MIYISPKNPYSYLTAKRRKQASFPTRFLLEQGRIRGKVLDFGCGLGADTKYLQSLGCDVAGYDPYYAPDYPLCRFDTILCHYVLNVLLPEEQPHVLMCIAELLHPHGKAYYTVRRDLSREGFRLHRGSGVYVYQRTVHLPFKSILRNSFCEIYEYQHYNQIALQHECPFCSPPRDTRLLTETERAYAIATRAVDAPSKILVVPKLHVSRIESELRDECRLIIWRIRQTLYPANTIASVRICRNRHQHAYILVSL